MNLDSRSKRIKKKYKEDQQHIAYLLSKGWHPLKIADQMTHNMIILLRKGIENRHPDWEESQIIEEMRRNLKIQSEFHRKRGIKKNG